MPPPPADNGVTVPNVVGQRRAGAESALSAVGLHMSWPDYCEDVVTGQSPAASARVEPGTVVRVDFKRCVVPDVVGMRLPQAIAAMQAARLPTRWFGQCDDLVTGTSPSAGTLVAPNTEVALSLVSC